MHAKLTDFGLAKSNATDGDGLTSFVGHGLFGALVSVIGMIVCICIEAGPPMNPQSS